MLANHQLLCDAPAVSRVTHGKGSTQAEAVGSALGEAVERYSASIWTDDEIVRATRDTLVAPSVDPRHLVLYAPDQYKSLPFTPYTDATVLGWMQGFALGRGHPIFIPALAVLMNYRALLTGGVPVSRQLQREGSTAPDLAEAVRRGVLEVMERDAFMIAWLNTLPCLEASPGDDHPDAAVKAARELLGRRGIALRVFRVPTDWPCNVFIAVAVAPDGMLPAATAGLGVSADPAEAASKAVLEVCQIRPALGRALRDGGQRDRMAKLLTDTAAGDGVRPRVVVCQPDDGAGVGLPTESAGMPVRLANRPVRRDREPSRTGRGDYRSGILDILYVDLTPADMYRRGLSTARVIIPNAQPIDFGIGARRLGAERSNYFSVDPGVSRCRLARGAESQSPSDELTIGVARSAFAGVEFSSQYLRALVFHSDPRAAGCRRTGGA